MKRIVTIDDSTGNVLGTWMGGDEQDLPAPPAGQTRIAVPADDATDYGKKRWTGAAFVDRPAPGPAPPSQMDRLETKLDQLLAK